MKLYGKQVIVNLAEQHGKEGTVVAAYKDGVAKMAREDVKWASLLVVFKAMSGQS